MYIELSDRLSFGSSVWLAGLAGSLGLAWLGFPRGARLTAALLRRTPTREADAPAKRLLLDRPRTVDLLLPQVGDQYSDLVAKPSTRLYRPPLRLHRRPGGDYFDLVDGLAYTGALLRLDRGPGHYFEKINGLEKLGSVHRGCALGSLAADAGVAET